MSDFYYIIYHVAMVISLGVSFFLVVLMWRRREFPGAPPMMVLAAATFTWTLGFLLETHGTTLKGQLIFDSIGYIGSMSVPVAWFVFALKYVSSEKLLARRHIAWLSVFPAVTVLLVWTNGWHHLMWANEGLVQKGPFLLLAKTYRPFFWVALSHNYLLVIAGACVLMWWLFVGSPVYKRQAVSLIIAVSLPLLWNAIYVFRVGSLPKDLTPAMFAFSGLALTVGLLRFQMFRAVPFARKFVIREMSDGILILDRDRLVEANPAALKMIGADKSIVGKRLEDLLPISPLFGRLSSGKAGRTELQLSAFGEPRFYDLNTRPMCDGEGRTMGWLAMLHDTTARKKGEEKLRASYEKEKELRRSLENEAQKREQFSRALVHELKTPLTPIISTSELLAEGLTEEPWASMATNVLHGGENLNRRIDELLDLARGEIGKLSIEVAEVSPLDLLRSIVSEMTPAASQRGKSLVAELPQSLPVIRADEARLRQVIYNLIDNALKFSEENGTVTLRAGREDRQLVIEVEDEGPGLTVAQQARLFQPYERLDADRQKLSGLGLGLALSKNLVELHDGRIWVKSRKNKGSTFGFSIPIDGPPG